MDTTTKFKPRTMAELLPSLGGIVPKDMIQTLTAKKQPRQTMAQTSTSEKVYKPMTIAEMKADILALKGKTPRIEAGRSAATSARKKNWNSSVKVDKKIISHTANGQMKNSTARKLLNFQPKPKAITPKVSITMSTPKYRKPEIRAKKSLNPQANANKVRISGIFNIPETPVTIKNQIKSRIIVHNNPTTKKNITPQPVVTKKKIPPRVPDTPLSNLSWKSSCDESFLLKEKEINDIEEKAKPLDEHTLENIAEVSPPVSTPFKNYRNVPEFFNNTTNVDSTELNDDTIMCFDKQTINKENSRREESVIVSLCDLLNKATVNPCNTNSDIDELLELEKRTLNNLQLIENNKQKQLETLEFIRKLIHKKKQQSTANSDMDKTLVKDTKDTPKVSKKVQLSLEKSPILQQNSSVIKNSPSYKIPRRNSCLREKVLYKSMPNVMSGILTPNRVKVSKAKSMYMEIKEHMNFLNTPVGKRRSLDMLDTPAVTSHNLQKQLHKLFVES